MPSTAPTLQARIELKDLETQVRRMGKAHRDKKEAADFVAAEVSALHHLSELRSIVEKLGA